MKADATKTMGSARQAASYLLRDGRKVGIAIALVAVMAIMWLRVLTGQKPRAASATSAPAQQTPATQTPRKQMRYVELPVEAGRNDRIHRDFFTSKNWSRFSKGSQSPGTGSDTEVQKTPLNRTQEVAAKLAQTLRLEVVVLLRGDPQAVVNDRRVRVGDTLQLKDGSEVYAFEVVRIEEDKVLVTWNDRQWTLKLSPPTDVNK